MSTDLLSTAQSLTRLLGAYSAASARQPGNRTNGTVCNGPITIAIRARFEYDSTTIRLQHATTRYEVFRALAYEIVYENQW